MSDNFYACTPRETRRIVTEVLAADLVPFVQSSPGIGKSSIMKLIAEYYNLKLIDHRLSTSAPEDLSGLPNFKDDLARFLPFAELFPIEGTPLPKDYEGWLIFFDEFNSAPRAVQAASYKTILDRMTGQHRLHRNTRMAAAGNLATDRAIVNPISTAMQSRLVHIEMVVSFKEWLEDVALAQGYDMRIIAYLSRFPEKLMDFDPDHDDRTFCCPRTWEFVNKLVTDLNGDPKELDDIHTKMIAGTITAETAAEFVQFTKVFQNLPKIEDIRKDPQNCPVPQDLSLRWATITHMVQRLTDENFKDLGTYANRFDFSFQTLFFRMVLAQKPDTRHHPDFPRLVARVAKYLAGENDPLDIAA